MSKKRGPANIQQYVGRVAALAIKQYETDGRRQLTAIRERMLRALMHDQRIVACVICHDPWAATETARCDTCGMAECHECRAIDRPYVAVCAECGKQGCDDCGGAVCDALDCRRVTCKACTEKWACDFCPYRGCPEHMPLHLERCIKKKAKV